MPGGKLQMDNEIKYDSLDDILSDTDFGEIFKAKPKLSSAQNDDEQLIQSFEEINRWIDQYSHEPLESTEVFERRFYTRLKAIREDEFKYEILKDYDRHNLLSNLEITPKTLDDILNNDNLGLYATKDDDIFKLKHVPFGRDSSDFIARRNPCNNFAKYEPLFKQCQADLKSGVRQLLKFDERNLVKGSFFVLNGQLGYLENITEPIKRGGNRHDGRTYCIFENGTESKMQFLSLAARLYQARVENKAFTVSVSATDALDQFNKGFNLVNEEDRSSGYIYVLTSKSTNPKISEIRDLYKIGYSTILVEERIKNAVNEPTYLMSEVAIIKVYQCYNINPQKFEQLLHNFFGRSCLNVDVFDNIGQRYMPREWFIVPLDVIDQAIELIISGNIVNYKYDNLIQRLITI